MCAHIFLTGYLWENVNIDLCVATHTRARAHVYMSFDYKSDIIFSMKNYVNFL